ncbi:hypothetical protein BDV06DRAFT_190938 [Aspergillus oleicola]
MLSVVTARRTSSAFLRKPRTPTLPTRSIAFSTHPRPLQPESPLKNSNIYTSIQSSRPINPRNALNLSLQTRSITNLQRLRIELKQGSKGIWRKHPIGLSFAIFSLVIVVGIFGHFVWLEVTQTAPRVAKFPPKVGKELRKAIYYTDVDLQPRLAHKHYQEALKLAVEHGMYMFSDEVVGIRLAAADMMEKAGATEQAIAIFEKTKDGILKWVEKGRAEAAQERERLAEQEKVIEELKAQKAAQKPKSPTAAVPKFEIDNPEVLERYERMQELAKWEEEQRDKVYKKAVGIAVKLAELYEARDVQDVKKAEASREAAVEMSLKELAYRQSRGLSINGVGSASIEEARDADIPYVTRTEAAIALSRLAGFYNETGKSDLAPPLLLRGLELLREDEGGEPTCRQVDFLSDIAGCMGNRASEPFRTKDPEASRREVYANAEQWGMKALYMNETIPESKRDKLCHLSCVITKYNLAEMAESQGKFKEARKWYKDALDTVTNSAFADEELDERDFKKILQHAIDRLDKK